MVGGINMPKCLICDYQSGNIVYHLKSAHKLTTKEYRKDYPEAQVISDIMIQHASKTMTARNKSEKARQTTQEMNKSITHIEKVKQGLAKPSAKTKMSERTAKNNIKMWENPEYRKRRSDAARATQNKLNKNPEIIKKKSELFRKLWKDPKASSKMLNSYKKSIFGKPVRYKNYYCRSQGEHELILALEQIGATDIIQEHRRVPYYINGVEHTYVPDIECTLEGQQYLIEVKYKESAAEFPDKVEGALEYCAKNSLKFCWVRRFVEIPVIISTKSLNCSIVK